jgi:hypothetical protein
VEYKIEETEFLSIIQFHGIVMHEVYEISISTLIMTGLGLVLKTDYKIVVLLVK